MQVKQNKILVSLIIIILSFNIILYIKELTPQSFWSVVKYKISGDVVPEKVEIVKYLSTDIANNVVFYGHRGGVPNYLFPENSLEALNFASNLGVENFEIDVVLTKDNVPIVFHDIHMQRLTGINCFVKDLKYSEIKEIKLLDSQTIPSLSEVINKYPSLLIDLSPNSDNESKIIVDYLIKNHLKSIQHRSYIQTGSKKIINYIKKQKAGIKFSYNEWGNRIQNVENYKNLSNTFTLNPSEQITKKILNQLGNDKIIIAVIQNDNIAEFIRMKDLGIVNVMIDNAMIFKRNNFVKQYSSIN